VFKEHGLPAAIRSDNGLPFASPNGLYNLSRLSVFWLRLGIAIERIKPGHPQQNGRHERMHLTLKKEATRPACQNSLAQQARFDDFLKEFNSERPHEALGMKTPDEVYTPSLRPYNGLPETEYPLHADSGGSCAAFRFDAAHDSGVKLRAKGLFCWLQYGAFLGFRGRDRCQRRGCRCAACARSFV
jgi:hypothetical protein